MPQPATRPLPEEVDLIRETLEQSNDLTAAGRRGLNLVAAWASGKEMREVAARFSCSKEKVRRMRQLYQQGGVAAFLAMKPTKKGRPPLPSHMVEAVGDLLRKSIARGESLAYREVEKKTGVSRTRVAAIAKRLGLDAKHRRGPVAPPGTDGG